MSDLIQNATITSIHWNVERSLTNIISVQGDGWSQGFGGWGLEETASQWLKSLMYLFGLEDMCDKKIIGEVIRVKYDKPYGKIIAIGHPIKDIWLSHDNYLKLYLERDSCDYEDD